MVYPTLPKIEKFKLQKLKILAYKNEDRSGKPEDIFEAMFNPQSYSLIYKNVLWESESGGADGQELKYSLSKPEALSVTLILDNSGVLDYGVKSAINMVKGGRDIYKEVQRFLKLTCKMDGAIHEPNYLKIEWGDLIFDCRLESVEVKYTLFDRSGHPLRAEMDTKFLSNLPKSKRTKKESTDLTHVKMVKGGDTLPLMAQKVYNDPSIYIQVAQVNKLDNFRKLTVGQTLRFPPLGK